MTTDFLAGPFLTGRHLCDYSDDEGYAIPPSEAAAPSRATLLRQEGMNR
jgi:hypothetical protein